MVQVILLERWKGNSKNNYVHVYTSLCVVKKIGKGEKMKWKKKSVLEEEESVEWKKMGKMDGRRKYSK